MNPITRFCAVAVGTVSLLIAGALMDGPEDFSGEWEQSESLQALRDTQAGTQRRQVAAQKLCNEARGPNSEARWTDDDSLVCTTRRGVVVAGKR